MQSKDKNDSVQLSTRYQQYDFAKRHLRGTSRPEVFPFGETNEKDISTNKKRSSEHTQTITEQGGLNARGTFIQQLNQPTHSNDRVYGTDGVSPTLNTMQGGNRQPFVATRKDGMEVEMDVANPVTPDAYLTSGKRKVVNGKTELTSMHERRIRRLTPTECARLQGFPDNWHEGLSDTQAYKCYGNAVTVNVIRDIVEHIIRG